MSIDDKSDVLLSFCWITGKERDLMIRFPEFFCIDATENTNAEKRGLFMSSGLDGNCKMCLGINCLMPNGVLESFDWMHEVAMLGLGLREAIINFKLAMSDQERALYEPLENLSQVESPYKGLYHSLCECHLFEQPWDNKIFGNAFDLAEIDALSNVKVWIQSWFFVIVHEFQFIHSYTLFEMHMESNREIFQNCYTNVMDLWRNMKVKRFRWAKCYKSHVMHFDQHASSLSEAGNSSFKRFGATKTCAMKIDESANHKHEHSQALECKREM